MRWLRTAGSELLGLFVDDWIFAIAIAAWLAIVAVGCAFGIGAPAARGAILFVGLATLLIASVAIKARY